MFFKYVDIRPLEFDLYTLLIEESPNMTGQLSWSQSDTSLFNIHDALSCLVPKVNVKATEPCLLTITLLGNGRVDSVHNT